MERTRFRSTSLIDIQAELHQLELLRDAEQRAMTGRARRRRRRLPFGLNLLRRRPTG